MFCGTLVRIVDPQILEHNQGLPFLLQVWKRGGQLIFEKPLKRPVCNWNVIENKFLFQEDPNIPVVHMIHLYEEQ